MGEIVRGVRQSIVNYSQGENAYLDMYLMSKAKNNIIAHSTFSYWAAWLNANPDKIVIAPLYWLAKEKEKQIEAKWIRFYLQCIHIIRK